ncbi:MAG TPA: HEAT repeat domain-containing protein [Pirellulales bacterium]|nr:HEAT repeat domain-containing protein [Pirellulales bacterium]
MTALAVRAADAPKASSDKEPELIALLRSDAPKAEKALACKRLAVYGSSEAVGELAKLLGDEQLASWARIALEAIPGAAADEALRKAQDGLQGKLLVGVINSIGVRRDAKAAEALAKRLQDKDVEVASAAAAALGRIANDAATKSLRQSLAGAPAKVRSAIAAGLVLCAERLQAESRNAEAIEIYDEVREADVPKQRKIEATRAAILARKQDGITLLLEQFRSPDKAMFQLALGTAREFPGDQVDQALAAELARTAADRAALLIVAMADRKETVVLSAILNAAAAGPKPVRLAAIGSLGRVGDPSCLASLLEIAVEADAESAQAAKSAIAELPLGKVDAEIVARLSKAQGKTYPVLIELVGLRRIAAVEPLVKALDHSDPAVRGAALTSLGATVSAKQLGVLVSQAVAPKHEEDQAAARQALKTAAVRMPDREACAAELAAAMTDEPTSTKLALLEVLGAVGGSKALAALGAAAKTDDAQLQDASSRLLGEWMTIDAAPVLLDLAKTGGGNKYQGRELRGYIRIARQFIMPEGQRVEMCRNALDACRQPAERKLVLEVLKRYPNAETLKLAVKAMQTPEVKAEAAETALAIAQKVGELQAILSQAGLDKVKLEIVKAEYGAGNRQKDVTETLKKQLAGLPLVTLPSSSYNEAFGGDPAPGTPKQLKVQYRINGKAGEATFAENALIILPMPK